MITQRECPFCQGTGIKIIQSSSMLGLLKKNIPATCDECNGKGHIFDIKTCGFCEGQGLVGNESEICRACNGTGKVDSFAFIPRDRLVSGTLFHRKCESCQGNQFEIQGPIETVKLTKSWEREEELRQVEFVERVKVRCTECRNTYYIPIDKDEHQALSTEQLGILENLGVSIVFMYQRQ